ncbi:S-layer family protein [uncultured Megasphaera sp.]|uniref:beta strand repeat-containing protein n=1 Tax=uncultured Megasphaera sp. TaxID=165188 RepID=UPI0025D62F6C|nr:YadA-like family protein [uncultured Megasphaera sp.]
MSHSGGTEVDGDWDYIVKDSSWKGIVSDSKNYRNGYANLISNGKPKGFVRTTDAGSKLAWNATLSAYTYNGKVVDYSNIYVIDGEIGVFTNASGSEVYTGTVFGKNNEVLMTVKKSDGSYYSYWGAEVNDAGATMDTYRVAEYQKDLNVLRDNDFALYHNDIKSVDMSTNDSSATISLMRNGDGTTSPAVDGTLTLTKGGGTGGKDTYVSISNTTNGQEVSKTFTTGSKVSAIGSTNATTGLTINGVDYTIKAGKDYKAGANIQISDDNTISATDTKYTAGANVNIDENNVISAVDTDTKYTAGKNITIDGNNVISAKEYTEGTNVSIDENNKISAKNTTLTNGPAEKSVDATSGGVTYTIKDTDGNAVTLEDVASATTVNHLIDGAKVHYFSVNASANEGNYNNDGAGNLSIAIGANTSATEEATAVGNNSTADERSAAFGYLSDARGTRAVAIGTEASTNGMNSTAIGQKAVAGYYKSDADQVQAEAATAVGSQAEVHANYGTAVGESAKVLSESGTALGMGAQIWENSANGVAVGRRASVGGNGNSAAYGIALGAESQAEAENGIAIGYDTVVSQSNSVALGSHATTNPVVATSSITIPNTNTTYNVNGTAPVGTVSVGSATGLRTITNVAAGRVSEASTDAVNGSELYAVATEAAKHTTITTEDGSRIKVDSQPNSAGGTEYILDVDTSDLANYSLTNLSQKGETVITNLAKGVERHIKPYTYAVDDNGTVTMTYVNGNGEPVKNMTATITGIAKSDLSNITNEGNTYITKVANKAVKVIDGKNTTVTPGKDGDVTTYAVNVDTSGKIEQNNNNIVTGDTVYNALQNVSWTAKVNGDDAKIVAKDGTLNFVDGDNIAISAENGNIKISTTGLASSGDLWTARVGTTDVRPVDKKVNFAGSDHITVTGSDGQITFATTGLADTNFTNITEEGNTYIKKLAKGEDVHIKADTYTVGNDGSVTMTYVDGNGKPVAGEATITGIAKSDLTNITEGGKTIINNLAKEAVKVVNGTNTTVTEGNDGKAKTYAVNVDNAAIQAATDVTGENGISVTSAVENGVKKYTVSAKLSNNFAIDQATGNIDLAPSIAVGKSHPVTVNGNTGEITGLTNKTLDVEGFATKGRAATEEQLKEVNSKATAAKTTVTAGKNIAVNGKSDENGSAYTVALADNVSLGNNAIQLKGTDGSISAKSGGAQLAFNNSGLTVSQAKNGLTNETRIDGATITVDGGAGNQTIINGSTARIGSVLVNGGSGTATISGLTNQTTNYTGFANGSGRAATEEQLKEVAGKAGEAVETAGKGWNLTTNGKEASKTNIAPDGTVDFSSGNDNLVISNAGADLSFSLSDNLDLTNNKDKKGSVKVGENTALTDKLLQVGKDVSLTASALNVGTSSLTTSTLMVGGLTYINSSGINANGRVISNVAAGTLDTDAVNVGQLKSAINGSKVSIKAGDGITVEKTGNQYTIKTNIKGGSTSTGTVTVTTEDNTSTSSGGSSKLPLRQMAIMETAEMAAAEATTTDVGKAMTIANTDFDLKFKTDISTPADTPAKVNNGGTVNIFGDDVNVSTSSKAGTDSDTIRIALNKDIKVDSITAKTDGGQLNIKSEVNMNSQKITNLAEGDISETSTDAVTGSQLYNTNQAVIANAENINSLSTSVNKLDSRLNRVGAGAAALAALHPLDFDPDNKWDFAAGYGNYAGANAVAIGTYYRPNENTMFSIGGSFGGGENMVNAGVSFKLGQGGSGISTSKVAMAKKIKAQDELLKAQDAKMKEQDEKIAKLEALVAQQGEMIKQALNK